MLRLLVTGPHQVLEEVSITEVSLSQDGRSVEQDKRYHGNLTKLLPMGNEVEDFHELLAELTRQGLKMYHPAADIDKVNVGSLAKRQRPTKIKEEPANWTAKPKAEINHHHHHMNPHPSTGRGILPFQQHHPGLAKNGGAGVQAPYFAASTTNLED